MNFLTRRTRILQGLAALILFAGVVTWIGTGTHLGWTQTSAVTMQHDEITGIDYPVRRDAFVAGVEIPVAAAGLAGVLLVATLLPRLRRSAVRA